MSRVLVVGAGVGGLAVAIRLAAAGHRVTVCEAAPEVGGKLGTLTHEGFRFDTGPSLLTWPDVYRRLFEETGGWPDDLELQPLEPLTRYRFADGTTLDASSDPELHAARVEELRPGNGAEWRRFAAYAASVFEASREPFLASALDGPATLARLAARHPRDLLTIAPGRSLRAAARRLSDPRLRTYVDRYATYAGSDPRRAPAALAAVPHVEHAFGGWYVRGGLYRLAEALHARALELGVTVRLNSRVQRIIVDAGHARGVLLLNGEVLRAPVVVANADATHLYRDLTTQPAALRKVRRATPSLAGFVLLLAVEGTTPGLAHHNVLFPADHDAEFDAVFGDPGRPAQDPTIYVSAPDDAAVRPPGHEAWFVLVNAARHGTGAGALDWRAPGLAASYAEHLLDLLGQRGLPVRDRVRWSRILTPADLEQRTGAVGGAIYGTSSNGVTAAFLRPANRSPVAGLFLVGGSSHPGGGLPLVALSAEIVARLIGPA